MEEPWVRHVRSIAKKQQNNIVDGTIDKDNHLILKKRDGSHVDAGLIKDRSRGAVVYCGSYVLDEEPDIYYTKDGVKWSGATSPGRYFDNGNFEIHGGCWTGDRFLNHIYSFLWYAIDENSTILQSKDGNTWTFHPDKTTFHSYTSSSVKDMAATKTGLVVVVGYTDFGDPDVFTDSNIAISHDFGETWETFPYNDMLTPFYDNYLYGIAIKNENEWVVFDEDNNLWYTYDGGSTWSLVDYSTTNFYINYDYGGCVRYFNGCWWIFGYGYGSGYGYYDDNYSVLMKSDDLVNWEQVMTPWSGDYPPLVEYNGGIGNSGEIDNLVYDSLTNTMIANGYSDYTSAYFMLSTNGGDDWFEIGFDYDDSWRTDYGWDGIYNWPGDWTIYYGNGMAYGYGWWFLVNSNSPDSYYPSLIRLSPDGKISEPVYLPQQVYMYGYCILSGGDVT